MKLSLYSIIFIVGIIFISNPICSMKTLASKTNYKTGTGLTQRFASSMKMPAMWQKPQPSYQHYLQTGKHYFDATNTYLQKTIVPQWKHAKHNPAYELGDKIYIGMKSKHVLPELEEKYHHIEESWNDFTKKYNLSEEPLIEIPQRSIHNAYHIKDSYLPTHKKTTNNFLASAQYRKSPQTLNFDKLISSANIDQLPQEKGLIDLKPKHTYLK